MGCRARSTEQTTDYDCSSMKISKVTFIYSRYRMVAVVACQSSLQRIGNGSGSSQRYQHYARMRGTIQKDPAFAAMLNDSVLVILVHV